MTASQPTGLLYVPASPSPVSVEDFNDWYDNEHAPARLTVPGIHNAYRYIADDDSKPEWMAMYDLGSPSILKGEAYVKMYKSASENEARIKKEIGLLDRRVYELIKDYGSSSAATGKPAECVLAVSFDPSSKITVEDLQRWYDEEHVSLFQKVPGWLRTRRYVLVDGGQPNTPKYLALHEWTSKASLDTEEFKHATSTPWIKDVFSRVEQNIEKRVWKFYKSFERPT